MQVIELLKAQAPAVEKASDGNAAFALLKKDFDARVKAMKKQADAAGKKLENAFVFCEEVFGDGQEMLILVTELTITAHKALHPHRHAC